jgi:branched-subunit amino acid ABC-type transport system permease component
MVTAMSFLAVVATNNTALDKLKAVPPAFWVKVGLAVLGLILLVVILRKLAQMNKVVLTVGVLIVFSVVGFSWIYNRNEPAWATPVVEKLAGFFPSKGSYATKQQTPPKP